jgi:hypothetical protein
MRNSITRRCRWPLTLLGILFLVASLMVPGPARAMPFQYTYTGNTFVYLGGNFPSSPHIGPNVLIQFIFDGTLLPGTIITNFTASSGDLVLTSSDPDVWIKGMITDVSDGLPTNWDFLAFNKSSPGFQIESVNGAGTGGVEDVVTYLDSNRTTQARVYNFGYPGVWYASSPLASSSSVPLPPGFVLFGTGFLGLVGLRKFRKA